LILPMCEFLRFLCFVYLFFNLFFLVLSSLLHLAALRFNWHVSYDGHDCCCPISASASCLSRNAPTFLSSTLANTLSSFGLHQHLMQHFQMQALTATMAASTPPATIRMAVNPFMPVFSSSSSSLGFFGLNVADEPLGSNVGLSLGAAVGDKDGAALGLRVG
jgi:hypothetical protein